MALGQAIFRDNRRRRVLQDEARRGGECLAAPVQEGARYTDAAGVENHPQITQFIPRRYRSYAFGLFVAAAAIGLVATLHAWAGDMARAISSSPIAAFDLAAGGGLAAWLAAIWLLGVAAVAWMVYTLRRHRVDDYKARYRLWLWVAASALLASGNSVARLHEPWSDMWVRITGWSAASGTVWWLAPVGLIGLWLAVRLVLETTECRGACVLVCLSLVAYVVAGASAIGALPTNLSRAEVVAATSALLAGHALSLAAVTLYARYVVLDVQGLIVHTAGLQNGARVPAAQDAKSESANGVRKGSGQDPPATLPMETKKRHRREERSEDPENAWVDGSTPDDDHFDNDNAPRPKLSKADRKRLRKQRRQCA